MTRGIRRENGGWQSAKAENTACRPFDRRQACLSLSINTSILQTAGTVPTGSRHFLQPYAKPCILAGKPYIFLATSLKVWHFQIAQKTPRTLAPTGFAGWSDPGVGRKSHTPFNQHRNRATDSCREGVQICRNRQRKKGRSDL